MSTGSDDSEEDSQVDSDFLDEDQEDAILEMMQLIVLQNLRVVQFMTQARLLNGHGFIAANAGGSSGLIPYHTSITTGQTPVPSPNGQPALPAQATAYPTHPLLMPSSSLPPAGPSSLLRSPTASLQQPLSEVVVPPAPVLPQTQPAQINSQQIEVAGTTLLDDVTTSRSRPKRAVRGNLIGGENSSLPLATEDTGRRTRSRGRETGSSNQVPTRRKANGEPGDAAPKSKKRKISKKN